MSPAKRPSLIVAPISAAFVAFIRAIRTPIDKPLKTHGFARPRAAIPSRIREVRENLGWIPEGEGTAPDSASDARPGRELASHFLLRRDLGGIPSATQRFDQLNARHHLLHSKIDRRLLVSQQNGLS